MRVDAGAHGGAALRQLPAGAARPRCSRAMPFSICVRQPDSSCASVTGIASIRCVRPVLTMPADSCSFAPQRVAPGARAPAAACSRSSERGAHVDRGRESTSLLLWPMLTWSFGCTAVPRRRRRARAITSLAFMLVLVPEPVWNTSIGKCAVVLCRRPPRPRPPRSPRRRRHRAARAARWPRAAACLIRPARDEGARQRPAADRESSPRRAASARPTAHRRAPCSSPMLSCSSPKSA